jgi:hypothetical protein
MHENSEEYLKFLQTVADEDVKGLEKAQKSYGNSWKKRGGVGAFMMLARKWDRLENALQPGVRGAVHRAEFATVLGQSEGNCGPYDILVAAEIDRRSEGIIDDVRDLRRYLLLVEAELRARGIVHGTHRDNVTSSGVGIEAFARERGPAPLGVNLSEPEAP